MSFNDYKPQEVTIETDSTPITLRGLNVDDLSGLIQRHGALIETWFEGEIDPMLTVTHAPALVADMIACAAGQPDAVDKAAQMPIGLQARAIAEVFKLTFREADMGNAVRLFVKGFTDAKQPTARTNRAT